MLGIMPIVAFIGLNALAYMHARAMLQFTKEGDRTATPEELSIWRKAGILVTGVNIPRPESARNPLELAAYCQVEQIEGTNGITLESWYCNQGESTPLVILFHGYSTEKTSLLEESKAFLDMGYSVLLVDFRGSGGSSESYTTIGIDEAKDVTTVFRYAEAKLLHTRIILYGFSMGSVAILKSIHDDTINPDAIILGAVFARMSTTIKNRFRTMGVPSWPSSQLLLYWAGKQYGFDGSEHNPIDFAPSVNCPTLFMHGADDPRASFDQAHAVYDSTPGNAFKRFEDFRDIGHESYIDAHPLQWRTAIESFLKESEIPKILEPDQPEAAKP